jgi:ribonuclease R
VPAPKDYAKLLNEIKTRPDAHIIQMMLLRSLSQAVYSAENKGHFGLAYDAYTHFTSPIRRYPDLIVHRGIRRLLQKDSINLDSQLALDRFGEHCSMTERRADEATREVVDWLKCEYMLNKVGETFAGLISSVTAFGFFVELKDVFVEGLVHISTLPGDYYQFEPTKQALRGERTGKLYQLGGIVQVTVARVDLDQRLIDFQLLPERGDKKLAPRPKKAKDKKNKKFHKESPHKGAKKKRR